MRLASKLPIIYARARETTSQCVAILILTKHSHSTVKSRIVLRKTKFGFCVGAISSEFSYTFFYNDEVKVMSLHSQVPIIAYVILVN